jgi:hypothetical protein
MGLCPHCHKTDGYVNLGKAHYARCDEHRVSWMVGFNLFSSWRHETEDDWRRNRELLKGYKTVEPYHTPETRERNKQCQDVVDINYSIYSKAAEQPGTALMFTIDSMSCSRCGSPMKNDPRHVLSMKLPEGLEYFDPHLGPFVSVVWARCLRPVCCPSDDEILNAIALLRDGHRPTSGPNFMAMPSCAKAWRKAHGHQDPLFSDTGSEV